MTDTSPATDLSAAADRIRELAKAVSAPDPADQPFHAEGCDITQGAQSGVYEVATTQTSELADYIAAMHPGVGLALADLLDDQAFGDDEGVINPWALAVARAVLNITNSGKSAAGGIFVRADKAAEVADAIRSAAGLPIVRTVENRLRISERRRDELREESLRRGKNVLDQSEKIRALEREIGGVRHQLGAEILRANQAEADIVAEKERADGAKMLASELRARVRELETALAAERARALSEAADTLDATDPPEDYSDTFDACAQWATAELRRLADATAPSHEQDDEQPAGGAS